MEWGKLEYSDLYRFQVSLGVILIVLALLIPCFFLKEPFDLGLKAEEISKLTATAQIAVAYRQYTVLWFIRNSGIIFVSLMVSGIALLITGIVFWFRKKQSILDQDAMLDIILKKLKIKEIQGKLEPLTVTQIAEKSIEKGVVKGLPDNLQKERVQESLHVENLLIERLAVCFGSNRLLIQQSVRQIPLDAVLIFHDSQYSDVIFDIRAVPVNHSENSVEEMVRHFSQELSAYVGALHRHAVVIPVFIFTGEEKDKVFIQKVETYLQKNPSVRSAILPLFILKRQLASISNEDLIKEVQDRAAFKPEEGNHV